MKSAWPIRFIKYIFISLHLFVLSFIYSVVQLDLWILTKRNGPIPQAVRLLVVSLGFFFLLTAYLACNGGSTHCGPSSPIALSPQNCLMEEEIEKIIGSKYEKLRASRSEILESLFNETTVTVDQVKDKIDNMIAAFHQNFQEHQGLIYNLESKQNSYIDEKIKENLKNMGHLSFSEFEQLKDVYRNQIDDNVYKFSREISQKVDDLVETIKELDEYRSKQKEEIQSQTSNIYKKADDIETKMKNYQSQLVVTQEEIVKLIHAICDEKLKEYTLSEITEDKLREIVKDEVYLYSADQIGLPDFALASAGGFVENVEVRIPINADTDVVFTNNLTRIENELPEKYHKTLGITSNKSTSSSWSEFIHPIDKTKAYAQRILSPENYAGNCWPFIGTQANVTIRLACPVEITSITFDHIHPKIDPMNGKTALREFVVFGVTDQSEFIKLIDGYYNISERTPQQFFLQQTSGTFKRIFLEIKSNHGALYTCLYRVRVHSTKGCRTTN